MKTVTTVNALRTVVSQARQEGKIIGLVPTMGCLHDGHLALIERARHNADFVVASIFVNPLQFGPHEDLDKYPRTFNEDQRKLTEHGCHLLFHPDVTEMYPQGTQEHTRIIVPGVSEGLCGSSRPGHFEGVATVVSKLLQMAQPDLAVFGEKDYQQLAVIRRMVHDLNMPIRIIGEPIQRDRDGLALSSRNTYLSAEQRSQAPELYRCLQQTAQALKTGQQDHQLLLQAARQQLENAGFELDYLEIRAADTLHPVTANERRLVILAAVFLGSTRLIDNIGIELD